VTVRVCGVFYDMIAAFARRDLGNLYETSVKIFGLTAEILMPDLQNMKCVYPTLLIVTSLG
jgi:hypothetical protein